MSDFICDLNCPNVPGVGVFTGICCSSCRTARRGYLNKDNEHLWTDEKGFLGDEGCRLPREQVPEECRVYDCRDKTFYVCTLQYAIMTFQTDRWVQSPIRQRMMVGWASEETLKNLAQKLYQQIVNHTHENLETKHSD